MTHPEPPSSHHCRPERGAIGGAVFYSSKSRSWTVIVVPPAGPPRQQRMDVRFCPWCGRDLADVVPDEDAALLE